MLRISPQTLPFSLKGLEPVTARGTRGPPRMPVTAPPPCILPHGYRRMFPGADDGLGRGDCSLNVQDHEVKQSDAVNTRTQSTYIVLALP